MIRSAIGKFAVGAVAGLAATVPMTITMAILHASLPRRERHPLPPRHITMQLAAQAGVAHELDEDERKSATMTAHFAYGSLMGGLYGAIVSAERRPITCGVAYGAGVWVANYLALLPAADLQNAFRETPPRNALMLAAHLVYGGCLGLFLDRLPKIAAPLPQHGGES